RTRGWLGSRPMRLVTYDAGDGGRAGMVVDGRVVDAWATLGEPHRGSLKELIARADRRSARADRGYRGAVASALGGDAAAADPGPREDHLHRPQLRQTRGRGS